MNYTSTCGKAEKKMYKREFGMIGIVLRTQMIVCLSLCGWSRDRGWQESLRRERKVWRRLRSDHLGAGRGMMIHNTVTPNVVNVYLCVKERDAWSFCLFLCFLHVNAVHKINQHLWSKLCLRNCAGLRIQSCSWHALFSSNQSILHPSRYRS